MAARCGENHEISVDLANIYYNVFRCLYISCMTTIDYAIAHFITFSSILDLIYNTIYQMSSPRSNMEKLQEIQSSKCIHSLSYMYMYMYAESYEMEVSKTFVCLWYTQSVFYCE